MEEYFKYDLWSKGVTQGQKKILPIVIWPTIQYGTKVLDGKVTRAKAKCCRNVVINEWTYKNRLDQGWMYRGETGSSIYEGKYGRIVPGLVFYHTRKNQYKPW